MMRNGDMYAYNPDADNDSERNIYAQLDEVANSNKRKHTAAC